MKFLKVNLLTAASSFVSVLRASVTVAFYGSGACESIIVGSILSLYAKKAKMD